MTEIYELIAVLKSTINPSYQNIPNTESFERRLCVEALESLQAENAGLKNQRNELLEALNNALPLLHTGDEIPMSYYADKPGVLGEALRAIARAKGE